MRCATHTKVVAIQGTNTGVDVRRQRNRPGAMASVSLDTCSTMVKAQAASRRFYLPGKRLADAPGESAPSPVLLTKSVAASMVTPRPSTRSSMAIDQMTSASGCTSVAFSGSALEEA